MVVDLRALGTRHLGTCGFLACRPKYKIGGTSFNDDKPF